MSDRFAILVTFRLKPGMAEAFRPLILKNAEAAVANEPDCHAFHVMNDEDDPDISSSTRSTPTPMPSIPTAPSRISRNTSPPPPR